MIDPFDKVLKELGVYQPLQDTHPIPDAPVPPTDNGSLQAPCRIQGLPLKVSDIIQHKIALQLIKYVHRPLPGDITHIRPISLLLNPHGKLFAEPIRMLVDKPASYPARYRIPPSTIRNLYLREQIWRSENFALGTLLYELHTGQEIFDGQSDEGKLSYGKYIPRPRNQTLPRSHANSYSRMLERRIRPLYLHGQLLSLRP